MNHTIKEIQERFSTEAKIKSEREQARIIEASKLQAKKIVFDAINANMQSAFAVIQQEIENYTKSVQYKKLLKLWLVIQKRNLVKILSFIAEKKTNQFSKNLEHHKQVN